MLLFVCFMCLLPSSLAGKSAGGAAGGAGGGAGGGAAGELLKAVLEVGVDAALKEIDNVWKGDVVRYWKGALENKSDKTLTASGSTEESGSLGTVLPDIPPGKTGGFLWEKSRGAATGAIGVIHYKYGDKYINLMASIPYDWNLYSAWSNVCISSKKESFDTLYNGKGSCKSPVKAGNWGEVDGVKFFLTNKSHAEFKVIFSG